MNIEEIHEKAIAMQGRYPGPWDQVGADNWRLKGFPQVQYNDVPMSYICVHDDVSAEYFVAAQPDNVIATIFLIAELKDALEKFDPNHQLLVAGKDDPE